MPDEGPTEYRLNHAGRLDPAGKLYTDVGSRSRRRVLMLDDALGRAWMRQKISDEEYAALRRYRFHWLAGGLCGPLGSVDLNRIFAHDPASMSGLAKTEKQVDHREAYYAARAGIGLVPAFVADKVALFDHNLTEVGLMLGYHSEARGRDKAREILSDAGYRLSAVWKERDR
jgi:hypothetical protein